MDKAQEILDLLIAESEQVVKEFDYGDSHVVIIKGDDGKFVVMVDDDEAFLNVATLDWAIKLSKDFVDDQAED